MFSGREASCHKFMRNGPPNVEFCLSRRQEAVCDPISINLTLIDLMTLIAENKTRLVMLVKCNNGQQAHKAYKRWQSN